METFLSVMRDTSLLVFENTLSVMLLAIVVGIVVWTIVAMIYRSKVARLRDNAAEELQERTRISNQLGNAEQSVQQLQTELNNQHDRIAQLEKAKQEEADHSGALTQQIEQLRQNLSDSAKQLDEATQRIQQLQTESNNQHNRVLQLEKEKQDETNRAGTLTQQLAQHTQHLTTSIQVLATFLEESMPEAETMDSTSLWQQHEAMSERMLGWLAVNKNTQGELQQTLDNVTAQLTEQATVIEYLQHNLANQTDHDASLTRELEQQQLLLLETETALSATKQQLQQLEEHLQRKTTHLEQLEKNNQTVCEQLEQRTSQFDSTLQRAEQSLLIQLQEKDALIEKLSTTIAGYENHIARLQDRLDSKKVLAETHVVTEPAQVSSAPSVEPAAQPPAKSLEAISTAAKQELQQVAEKLEKMPMQLQGLYNKVLAGFKK